MDLRNVHIEKHGLREANPIKLFFVDDDALFLKSLEIEFLQRTDFIIETYATGELCIENLTNAPDVIFLDYFLDGINRSAMNGIETLDKIKSFRDDIPVVMLSSQDRTEVAENCMNHKAFDYVLKSETAFMRLQKIITTIFHYQKIERMDELIIANKELLFQNEEKEKRTCELIIAKEKAEESDRLKTAFLQNMSHEIRTPLNSIIGYSELLNNDDLSKVEIKDFTDVINQSGQRLMEIVNNVLDISQIQLKQVEIEHNQISINKICLNLLTFFSPLAEIRNITLKFNNPDGKKGIIFSDKIKLHQILTNLINNAIKFTKSGSIEFGFEMSGNVVEFYVKDTGIGIRPEFFDKIFDRFSQVDVSISRTYEGAGLGLAICKGLIELLGGKIWLKSELNKGSTFFFTLPCK